MTTHRSTDMSSKNSAADQRRPNGTESSHTSFLWSTASVCVSAGGARWRRRVTVRRGELERTMTGGATGSYIFMCFWLQVRGRQTVSSSSQRRLLLTHARLCTPPPHPFILIYCSPRPPRTPAASCGERRRFNGPCSCHLSSLGSHSLKEAGSGT